MLGRLIGIGACALVLGGSAGAGIAAADSLVVVKAPAVIGTPAVGKALACDHGSWNQLRGSYSFAVAPTFAYQWLLNGFPIADAAIPAYAPIATDRGSLVSCQVTATLVTGTTGAIVTLTSTAVSPSVLVPKATTPPPVKTGCARFSGAKRAKCRATASCKRLKKARARHACLVRVNQRYRRT